MSAPPAFSLRRIAVPAFGPSLLFGLGEGAILPAIPLTARELGASVPEAALIVTMIGVGSLVSTLPASMITMRRGERWAIVTAALWCALAMVLCAWTRHIGLFAVAGFMIGMSQSVFNLARQSYLTEVVPLAFRARALSTLGGVYRVGMFVGPFLAAGVIYQYGLTAAYAAGIVMMLAAAAVAARIPDLVSEDVALRGAMAGNQLSSLMSMVRDHRHVFLTLGSGVMLVNVVRASRQAIIPLWADHLGLEPSMAALIFGVASAVDMLVFYPAGQLMDIKGRRFVALPSMAIMGLALLAIPWTHSATTLLLAAMLLGFGNGISSGLVMTLGADHSPRIGRPHFLGVWRLIADVGSASGPAILSALAASLTLGFGVAAIGLVAFVGSAQLSYWIPRAGRQRDDP